MCLDFNLMIQQWQEYIYIYIYVAIHMGFQEV